MSGSMQTAGSEGAGRNKRGPGSTSFVGSRWWRKLKIAHRERARPELIQDVEREVERIKSVRRTDPNEALRRAVKKGDVGGVETLLKCENVDVNGKDEIERTALHWAARQGNAQIVSLLLGTDHATSAGSSAEDGDSPKAGDQKPATGEAQGSQTPSTSGETAECKAEEMGESKGMADIKAKHANVDAIDIAGWTALHEAADGGHEAVVDLLSKTNITIRDKSGQTPLHRAVIRGHAGVVGRLLKFAEAQGRSKTSYVNIREKRSSRTALHFAAEKSLELVMLLLDHTSSQNPEEDGLNEARDRDNRRPSDLAAENGHEASVIKLIETATPPDKRPKARRSALDLAASKGHEEVVRQLLEDQRKLPIAWAVRSEGGKTALHLAAENGHVPIVRLLPTYKQEFTKETGKLSVHINKDHRKPSVAEKSGINIDALDSDGRTALYVAAKGGHPQVVDALLEKGADRSIEANDGLSAEDRAFREGSSGVIRAMKRGKSSSALPRET